MRTIDSILLVLAFCVAGCGTAGIDPEPDMGSDAGSDASDARPDLPNELPLLMDIGQEPFSSSWTEVELVSGFQGGWHIDVAVRLEGAGITPALLDSRIRAIGEHLESGDELLRAELNLDDGYWEHEGDVWILRVPPLAITPFEYPEAWIDTSIHLDITLILANGQVLENEVELILVDEIEEIPRG